MKRPRLPWASGRLRERARVALLAGLVALLLGLLLRNRWPARAALDPALFQEPLQTRGDVPGPFVVSARGYDYEVTPVFDYEIWGMVVSEHDSSSFIDLAHELWKDYVNVKDLCVIWGANLENEAYREMTFWSRDFTCHYSWTDPDVGALFSGAHLSNNHLVTDDPALARAIRSVRRGDQVHVRGWLVNYRHVGAKSGRKSSVTRGDGGDGACEVVWVDSFEVLRRANVPWRWAYKLSWPTIGLSLLGLLLL